MSANAKQARDAYAFSLRGAVMMNSHAFVPAIADDTINVGTARAEEARHETGRPVTRMIEDYLARYFAPGCREAA